MSLTFYTNPMSRGRMVRWMLEEVGATYDTVVLDYGPKMKTPEYLAVNPMGKVPALIHEGQVITECPAIILWLAQAYPQAGLLPADLGALYRWMFFGAGPLEQAVVNGAMGWLPEANKQGRLGYGSMERVVGTLTAHLTANRFLCGETFSAADVYVGSQIGWGLRFGSLPDAPIFRTYWAQIADRPALVRANAADDALKGA